MYINFTPFSGVAEFCNPVIFKRTTGELIVDGSITTDKLAANSITSAKILAGSIQAAHIAAGTITGDRIAANQTLSAPTINGGTVTGSSIVGGNLNIGSGKFTVTSAGDVAIKPNGSSTTAAGLYLTNKSLIIKNAALVIDTRGKYRDQHANLVRA